MPETPEEVLAVAAPAAEEAPKPKTTRTRKKAEPAEAPVAEEAPKPKRGRPKKAKAAEEAPAEALAAEETPKPKATRTRKKAAEAPAESAEAPLAEEAPKPKRTRRTKKAEVAEEAPVEVPTEAPAAEETPAKPKRTRRTKKVDEAPAEPAAETPAEAPAAEEAPKPKRTRRTKKAEAAPEAAAEDKVFADAVSPEELLKVIAEAKAAAEAATEEAPKPKRTRRTKKADEAPAEPAAETPAPEAPVAEQEATGAEEAPAKPKRSRRKKAEVTEGAPAETPAETAAEAPAAEQPAAEQPAASEEAAAGEGTSEEERPSRRKRERNKRNKDAQDKAEQPADGKAEGKGEGQKAEGRLSRRERYEQKKKAKRERNKVAKPSFTREELEALKVTELRAKAAELAIDHKGLLKAALIDVVYEGMLRAEGFVEVEGVLDLMPDGFGFVRTSGYLGGKEDAYVHASMVRRTGLRKGDYVKGQTRPARQGDKFPALQSIASVNGRPVEELANRPRFADLTPVFPDERLFMEHGKNTITARVIDLCAPIGKGQRGLIVSPPKAGKTTVLKNIAAAITANNPEVHLMCLLVDERPEEVTDMQRSIHGEVIASTFDMPCENHIACAEMVIERAKRLVEYGEDVVILLDSLTRLARAYNLAQPASGRILSGGVDSTALYPPKKFLGAARNIEGGGSLTILASALVETGSKMDEVIFEEFKGTGNMELKLDRQLADRRIFPAIDPVTSGTRREDLLLNPQEAPLVWAVRDILAKRNNTERAMDTLIKSLRATRTNQEFLIRAAKQAQAHAHDENFDL